MSEFKQITGIDQQPYFSFLHNDKEYFIWFWLSDGGPDVSRACLSTPVPNGQGGYVPNNVLTMGAYKEKVAELGGHKTFMRDHFIPKVNEYLAAQGGNEPEPFPSDGESYERFNWLVENTLSYVAGQVVMSDVP